MSSLFVSVDSLPVRLTAAVADNGCSEQEAQQGAAGNMNIKESNVIPMSSVSKRAEYTR